jgi:ribonuclease HI
LRDLKRAIKRAKNTACGPDGIHTQIIKNLPDETLRILLDIINDIWVRGDFPDIWREAFIVPIPKPDKDHTNRKNYRPIALTSQLCKIMERMVNERLMHYLESSGSLHHVQCGFRKNRNCLDHLIRLETYIREAFAKDQQAMAVFFDLEKAYDTTWKYGILKDLYDLGIRGNLAHYISKFLDNRVFRVKLGNSFSQWHHQEEGVPQGSILSVTLFIVKINDIAGEVKDPQMSSLFVDDFAIVVRGKILSIMERHLQITLDKVQKWAIRNGFKFSIDKTVCIRFHPSKHMKWEPLHEPTLNIGPNKVKCKDETKFLGLIFDRTLSFQPHINNLKKKCQKALNLLKVVAHQHWGADKDTILKLYRAIVRSKLDYGSVVYGGARPSYLKKLDPVQNQAMRLALGAFHSSPIPSLNALCMEPPLSIRRTKLSLSYSSKLLGHPKNPAYKDLFKTNYGKKYFKNDTMIKPLSCRISQHIETEKIPFNERQVLSSVELAFPVWETPHINTDLELSFLSEQSDSSTTMLNSFLQHRDQKYKDYNEIYTDGSKKGKRVGCAVIKKGRNPVRCRLPDYSTVYSAELFAIKVAIQYTFISSIKKHVIFTDSEAAVKTFQNLNCVHPYVAEAFNILHKNQYKEKTIVLCWIPSHVGIQGNELADREAKKALQSASMLSKIPFTDLKPMTTEYCNKLHQSRWEEEPSNKLYNIQNDLKHMPSPNFEYRSDETRFYRCLIGHTKITHSFLFEREEIPQCNTCQLPISIKHIFTECISYQHQQQQYLQNKQSLSNIFLELPSENIIAFLKESDLYYKV